MSNPSKLVIIDYKDNPEEKKEIVEQLPPDFGYNLDTIEKARKWLTNPKNWFRSELFILKWDGIVPRISEKHGQRLINEPWDDGLPWAAVYGQKMLRNKRADEKEAKQEEHNDE
jgi:hypothetical protein